MSHNRLSRRDFLMLTGAASAGLTLAACGVKVTELSTLTPSPTLPPTLTPTQTTEPANYIEGLEEFVPKPDGGFIEQVVSGNYINVMGITRDQVKLNFVEYKDNNNQPYTVMVDEATDIPLAVYANGAWQESKLKFFGKQIGIVMGTDTLQNPTTTDLQLMAGFDRATVTTGTSWDITEIEKGVIDPSQAKYVETLIGMLKNDAGINNFIYHNLNQNYPEWLKRGNYSKDELRESLHHRIEFEMGAHPDIQSWVVWNEPYLPNTLPIDPFYEPWGNNHDYIIEAFQVARNKNPDALLILNAMDNHTTQGGSTPVSRDIVKKLHERGLIDYLGMQMHFNQWCGVIDGKVDTDSVAAEIAYYKSIDVSVLITELTYEPTETELAMTNREFNDRLSTIFEQIFAIAIASGNVKGITFWGVSDKYIVDVANWFQIFDVNDMPKQSYYVVLRALYQGLK
jgi:hypothetical protein